jgi:hypothetical protein
MLGTGVLPRSLVLVVVLYLQKKKKYTKYMAPERRTDEFVGEAAGVVLKLGEGQDVCTLTLSSSSTDHGSGNGTVLLVEVQHISDPMSLRSHDDPHVRVLQLAGQSQS